MTATLSPIPVFKWVKADGTPAVGYKIWTYIAGTSTPRATFVDQTETTQNTNPITLNANGEALIWLGSGLSYKFILEDDALVDDGYGNLHGSVLRTWDYIANVDSTAVTLRSDLDSAVSTTKGAGMVGCTLDAAYASDTVGGVINQLNTDLRSIIKPVMQGRLEYQDATHIKLARHNGTLITINDTIRVIPTGGVSLAIDTLTPATVYYIYAYWDTSVTPNAIKLLASDTAGPATGNGGFPIMTGDASRTYLGWVVIDASLEITDNPGTIYSYYNANLDGMKWTKAGTYSWICPDGITRAMLTLGGAGAGGSGGSASYHGGGGGGGAVVKQAISLTPGTSYTITIGAGGTGGATGVVGADGADTSFHAYTAIGGKGGTITGTLTGFTGGDGGGCAPGGIMGSGGAGGASGADGDSTIINNQLMAHFDSGAGGGGGSDSTVGNGGTADGSVVTTALANRGGGGGGSAFGSGADCTTTIGGNAIYQCAGGSGGAKNAPGGNGADGYCSLEFY